MKRWMLTIALAAATVLTAFEVDAGALEADLAVTKTDGAASSVAGTPITYTIVVTNNGPTDVTGATVSDTFPAALSGVDWTCVASAGSSCTAAGMGNVADSVDILNGGNVTYTATADIDPGASGTLENTASVTAPMGITDPSAGNNSATDTNTLTASADLGVTKTDGSASSTPGTSVVYTIVASNSGPSDVTGATVSDVFPAELSACSWTCTASAGSICTAGPVNGDINDSADLLAGGSATYAASCDIAPGASGTLDNTASITAPMGVTDGTPGNNSATDSNTLAASADLAITKTDGSASSTPGTSVVYTIVASNSGPSDATGATVSDAFPAELSACSWTCTASAGSSCAAGPVNGDINDSADLLAGGSAAYTASCDIAPDASGTLDNTATVTAPMGVTDGTPGNNSATDSNTLVASADLAITKTDNATEQTPGTSVSYTIVAANNGPSTVADALVSDTFAAPLSNCTWTSAAAGGASGNTNAAGDLADTLDMPVGSSVTYTVTCDIDPAATGDLSNTATIGSDSVADPTAANDSATDISALTPSADLVITKTDNATQHTAGIPISYTIVAENNGPSAVDDALVSDTFPAPLENCSWTSMATGGATGNTDGSGNLADVLSMPVGSTVTYTATCDVPSSASGVLSNTATINSATAADPNAGTASATDGDTRLLSPAVPVPTLNLWSLLIMLGALALFGGASVGRRLV